MLLSIVVAAGALYTFCVHTFGGQRLVVDPLLQNHNANPFSRSVLEVVWHYTTFALGAMAAIILASAWLPVPQLLDTTAIQLVVISAIFLVLAPRRLTCAFDMPQWLILAPLAIFVVCIRFNAPFSVPIILSAMAFVHLGWVFGLNWPTPSRERMPMYVIGRPANARMPGALATVTVAVVLFALAAGLVLNQPWARWACVAIFAVRGIYGFFEERARPEIRGTPYARLNLIFFSPLCLLLAGVALFEA